MKKIPKKGTLARAKHDCWKAFSQWIKYKYSEDGETVNCYTCSKVLKLGSKELHGSHCLPKGGYPGLYFHENNVRPACSRCNLWLEGNTVVFVKKLVDEIGQEEFDKMYNERHSLVKPTKKEYEEMAKDYKDRITKIKEKW